MSGFSAPLSDSDVAQLALRIRQHSLAMIRRAGSAHLGTCFSMAELLAVLYGGALRIDPSRPDHPARDRFILSKGHGAAALYAVLAEAGFFPVPQLDTFYQNGSVLAGHVTRDHVPGVEVSTGALGHGLSIGAGMALAAQRARADHRVFVLLSDGECDEGLIWEAVLFAPHHRLDNLVAIVDYNKIQSFGTVAEVLGLEPFADKWRAFGWAVREVDGHSIAELREALGNVPFEPGRPSCLMAHTVKGKGLPPSFANTLRSHYECPKDEEYAAAARELGLIG